MWKAIINYINSKAIRCDHDWELLIEISKYKSSDSKMPYQTRFVYRCTKCCESKIIKT